MPLQEQFARVWLLTLVITYSLYFAAVPMLDRSAMWDQLLAFGFTTFVQVIVIGVSSAVMELRHGKGPKRDERDQAIDRKATQVAYHVLLVGVILTGCVLPFAQSGWPLFHAAVGAIAVAEIVRNGITVVLYRRGWHG
jgi:peptidoglycan/LPS O-acetylase OafA/YrhL